MHIANVCLFVQNKQSSTLYVNIEVQIPDDLE